MCGKQGVEGDAPDIPDFVIHKVQTEYEYCREEICRSSHGNNKDDHFKTLSPPEITSFCPKTNLLAMYRKGCSMENWYYNVDFDDTIVGLIEIYRVLAFHKGDYHDEGSSLRRPIGTYPVLLNHNGNKSDDEIEDLYWSPSGNRLTIARSKDCTILNLSWTAATRERTDKKQKEDENDHWRVQVEAVATIGPNTIRDDYSWTHHEWGIANVVFYDDHLLAISSGEHDQAHVQVWRILDNGENENANPQVETSLPSAMVRLVQSWVIPCSHDMFVPSSLVWSHDAKTIYFGIHLWDSISFSSPSGGTTRGLEDYQFLVYLNVETGNDTQIQIKEANKVERMALSPSAKYLAMIVNEKESHEHELWIWDIDQRKRIFVIPATCECNTRHVTWCRPGDARNDDSDEFFVVLELLERSSSLQVYGVAAHQRSREQKEIASAAWATNVGQEQSTQRNQSSFGRQPNVTLKFQEEDLSKYFKESDNYDDEKSEENPLAVLNHQQREEFLESNMVFVKTRGLVIWNDQTMLTLPIRWEVPRLVELCHQTIQENFEPLLLAELPPELLGREIGKCTYSGVYKYN